MLDSHSSLAVSYNISAASLPDLPKRKHDTMLSRLAPSLSGDQDPRRRIAAPRTPHNVRHPRARITSQTCLSLPFKALFLDVCASHTLASLGGCGSLEMTGSTGPIWDSAARL
jgi:hypothetical protein